MHPTPCNNIPHGVSTVPSLLRKSLTLSPSNHWSLKLPTHLYSEGFPLPLYLKTSSTPLHQFNPNPYFQQSNRPQSISHQQLSNSFQHNKQFNYQQYQHNKQLNQQQYQPTHSTNRQLMSSYSTSLQQTIFCNLRCPTMGLYSPATPPGPAIPLQLMDSGLQGQEATKNNEQQQYISKASQPRGLDANKETQEEWRLCVHYFSFPNFFPFKGPNYMLVKYFLSPQSFFFFWAISWLKLQDSVLWHLSNQFLLPHQGVQKWGAVML